MRRSPNRNFTAFMAGRYGADALGRFLSVCGCVCILISIAVRGKNAFFSAVFSAAALALLVWCILFKFALRPEEIPHLRGINLIPYAASVVVNGKVQISEIIENMLVFLPFGLCISAFYPDSEIQNRILLASGLSLFFEVTQYIFAIGTSDITDVIDNTLGAVIGILLYLGMKKIWKEKTGKIITILGAVLEVLFLALLFFTFAANGMF